MAKKINILRKTDEKGKLSIALKSEMQKFTMNLLF